MATEKAKTEAAEPDKAPQQTPFDIAKFAGIFAAIGMAIGYLGAFCTSVVSGIAMLKWWQFVLVILGIMLCISGPSMLIAYFKLRRRNLAPVLNANGWAINAEAIINLPFGATLTTRAKYPIVKTKDPFAQNTTPAWAKWLIAVGCLLLIGCILWLCGGLAWMGI